MAAEALVSFDQQILELERTVIPDLHAYFRRVALSTTNECYRHLASGRVVRVQDVGHMRPGNLAEMRATFDRQRAWDCPYLARYHGTLEDPDDALIISEHLDDSITTPPYNYMREVSDEPARRFEEADVAAIIWQVLHAIAYMSEQRALHGVLSGGCLHFGADCIKLSDWWMRWSYRNSSIIPPSVYWIAPEMAQSDYESANPLADVWSVGVTAIELLHGRPPNGQLHPLRVERSA